MSSCRLNDSNNNNNNRKMPETALSDSASASARSGSGSGSGSGSEEQPLQREEDGSLPGAAITYIRGCMKDALSQIWGMDMVEKPSSKRYNSPASESTGASASDEPIAKLHVNVVAAEELEQRDGEVSDGDALDDRCGCFGTAGYTMTGKTI